MASELRKAMVNYVAMNYLYIVLTLIVLIGFATLGSFIIDLNSPLSGELSISIESPILYYNHTNLTGFIYIAIATPRSLYSYGYPLKEHRAIHIDLNEAVRDWAEFYSKELSRLVKKGELPLPAIYVTLFLYDEKGREYVATYSYSTVTHFIRKG